MNILVFLFSVSLAGCIPVDYSDVDQHLEDFDNTFELTVSDEDYLDLAVGSNQSDFVRRIPIFRFRRRMTTTTTTTTTTVAPPRANTYSAEFLASANDYNISNRVLDIFYFSRYCGPGERVWGGRIAAAGGGNAKRISYADLDECCRQHDECPNYIRDPEQYAAFPGLEYRNQYFSRWVAFIIFDIVSISA